MAAPQESSSSGRKRSSVEITSNPVESFKDPLTSALDKDSEDEVRFL